MKENVPKVELEGSYEDFMLNNKVYIWQRTIDGMDELNKYPELEEVPVFIVFGGDLEKPKEFIIKRDELSDKHLDKAMSIMESNEEYEYCAKILELKDDKKGKK